MCQVLHLAVINLVDVLYPIRVPVGQLMCPPVPHLHRYWVDFLDELQPDSSYFFIIFSRRIFALVRSSTVDSDLTISLLQDGVDPSLTRTIPLTLELVPPTDFIDVFGHLYDS